MEGEPLLGVLRGLILDGEEQADFAADPSGYMQRAGYDDVTAEDLGEAVSLVADTLPPDVAHAVTTAAAGPEGEAAGSEGASGILERLASIDADDVPPLPIPPPAEPVEDLDDGIEDTGAQGEGGDATAFGDVTTDFDDDHIAPEDAEIADRNEDGDVDAAASGRDEDGDIDSDAAHDAPEGDDADVFGSDFDPFAEEAAEPSPAQVEAEGGEVPLTSVHDVDDDPIDFGEGVAAAPGTQADDADLDEAFAVDDDAFGSDAGFEEPALDEQSDLETGYAEEPEIDGGLDDGFDDDGPNSDVDDIGLS